MADNVLKTHKKASSSSGLPPAKMDKTGSGFNRSNMPSSLSRSLRGGIRRKRIKHSVRHSSVDEAYSISARSRDGGHAYSASAGLGYDLSRIPAHASSQTAPIQLPNSLPPAPIQAKLRFGRPGDKYEQEADRLAEAVMRVSEPKVQRQPVGEEEEVVKTKPVSAESTPLVQCQEETEDEEETEKEEEEEGMVQSSSVEAVSFTNRASKIAEAIRTRDSGSPMHPAIKCTLESYMGADLSGVRVHNDSSANQASTSLKARAFTHKNHIWLGPGESQTDLRLMSHETTHVLQQGGVERRKSLNTEENDEFVQTLPNSEAEQFTASDEPRSHSRTPSPPSSEDRSTVQAETGTEVAAAETTSVEANEEVPQERAEERDGRENGPEAAVLETVPETAPSAPADAALEDQERQQAVIERLEEVATQQEGPAASSDSQRQASEQAAEDASAAAPSPDNEAQSMGQAAQIETMNAQEAGEVSRESFLEIVRRRLQEIVPSTPNDLDEFRERGGASGLREGLLQTANQQAEGAQAAIRSATETEPSPEAARVPESLPEQAGPGQVPDLRAQEVLPQPREDADVSLEENRQEVEGRLAEENLTEDRLRRANDPRFTAVQEAREAVQEHADTAPQEYREEEQALLNEQEGVIAREETTAVSEMEQSRAQSQRQIEAQQQTAMTTEERARREVSDHIESIYTRTRRDVEGQLDSLNQEVESRFTVGERRARERFEELIDDGMTSWKLRRYGGRALIPVAGVLLAAGTWVYDKFSDINEFPEVRQIYEDGKNQYITDLDTVIVDIANLVESRLAWCHDQIQQSHAEVQEYVEGLPGSLREVGEQTSSRISERYDELRDRIEESRNTLADQLVERYQQARQALDQRLEEMRAENRGLVNRFIEGLQAVLDAIQNFRDRLMSILGEARDVIELILEDPIGFLGNLVDALKMGFRQFGANIWQHLRQGIMGWLFGTLVSAGITMPSEFSVRAVVGLILQVLGITYDRIRTKVARIIGERNVAMLERVWEYVSTLIREGPIGLWEQIREDLGDLKDMVIEGIKQWVVTRIITAAITRLVSMFNPVGAIVQAVMAIYNTVMFFIERIDQIMELVQGIVRSLGAIVRGQLGAAADRVEQVMGLTVPLIISFLARLLGLGGIAGTISNIIGRVRRRVDRAIDRGLRRIVRRIRGLIGRGRAVAARIVQWWRIRKQFRTRQGERHTLFFRGRGRNSRLFMASNNIRSIQDIINNMHDPVERNSANERLRGVMNIAAQIDQDPGNEAKPNEMRGKIDELADQLARTIEPSTEDLPNSNVTYQKRDRPFLVIADPLTQKSGNTSGSDANNTITDGYGWIRAWIRDMNECPAIHLLAARLHGPGNANWNLVFGHIRINSGLRNGPERIAYRNRGKKLKYTSHVNSYFNNIHPSGDPSAISGNLELIKNYVGYYICRSIAVKIDLWENNDYRTIYNNTITGDLPAIKGESRESDETIVRHAIRDSIQEENRIERGIKYLRFISPSSRLGRKWRPVSQRLISRGIINTIVETTPGGAQLQKVFIRENYINEDIDRCLD